MKTRVKTVMTAPEEDGLDYNVIINSTSHTTASCVCVEVYMYTYTHTQNNGITVTLDCGTVVKVSGKFRTKIYE